MRLDYAELSILRSEINASIHIIIGLCAHSCRALDIILVIGIVHYCELYGVIR